MKRIPLLCALLLLLTYSAISQTKPPASGPAKASDSIVCTRADDLRLLIASNENGKWAQKKLAAFQELATQYDIVESKLKAAIVSRDSSMAAYERLDKNSENIAITYKGEITSLKNQVDELNKKVEKAIKKLNGQRRKTLLVGIGSAIIGAFIYSRF